MTTAIVALLLRFHLAVVPVFVPSIGGVHDARETVGSGPRWHHILHTGELEQPDGAMIYVRFKY